MTLPKLSIAAKLYAIFALLASATVALSAFAVINARDHAALTGEFESANAGSLNVERVNGLLFAVQSAARGIAMSPDAKAAEPYRADLGKFNDEIDEVFTDWQLSVRADDASEFKEFSIRLSAFQNFAPELARIADESGPQAVRVWAEKSFPVEARNELTRDLETLGQHYEKRAAQTYKKIGQGIDRTALIMSMLAAMAVLVALAGAILIARSVARPLAAITRVTEAVANGDVSGPVPFSDRGDEIGALARSIGIFQQAMQHNKELNRIVVEDAETRSARQEQTSTEIARFSADVESTLSELGRISDQMLAASTQLAGAADELSAPVNEIDRQVAQSNVIASKAVSEA
ncbi:MAG: HAMP domain-containing protein, partial [Pseudolabrys sp.]|nr:HAMP domain-containing protein [Pseudolabrys sp.]